jgi:transcriptional regulator with XRE-family HTH domain
MTHANADELRRRLGRVLRRMRDQGGATLDEVDRITGAAGVRVTRSHLSRVENGEAELSVSRFLALMGAFGKPVGLAAEELLSTQSGSREDENPVELARRSAAWLDTGDPAAACHRLRAAFAGRGVAPADAGLLWLWSRAEARLGRWRAAFDATILRLAGPRPHPGLLASAAAAALASGRTGLARALAELVAQAAGEAGALLGAACALADGEPSAALARLDGAVAARPADWDRLLRADAYRRTGHMRSAQRMLAPLSRAGVAPLVAVEALRARARVERDAGKAGQALALADQALPRARRLGIPDLVMRVQRERADLLDARGGRRDASAARRAAGAIARRAGADPSIVGSELPLHGLLELLPVPLPDGTGVR